ncbi:GNAT family N-acetyltransferase [Chryseobacterium nematophagum]|uniref:GNAT family N-acetyltransferase n=1 Tax=Chryseobacterium nematophagum TaxID=2305228 RepID=A0A3M7TDP1_9FLAO|nr:GNAT family N-acetyltransferase [Chryseobacterium nematophagum]RNA61116.1 GNAT family N-acetyltransferase [Chryseobacterium nematophagum]
MNNMVWKIKSFHEFSVEELYAVLQARVDVFVVEQNCPYPDLDSYDQKAIHIWAEEEGLVLAYCRVFNIGIKYNEASLGRVLTTEQGRGKNLGKQLIRFAIDVIENRFNTSEIRISAQDYLLNFYGGFGFEDTGKKYLEDDIPHTEMIKK